jgi:hypothetical protein
LTAEHEQREAECSTAIAIVRAPNGEAGSSDDAVQTLTSGEMPLRAARAWAQRACEALGARGATWTITEIHEVEALRESEGPAHG